MPFRQSVEHADKPGGYFRLAWVAVLLWYYVDGSLLRVKVSPLKAPCFSGSHSGLLD